MIHLLYHLISNHLETMDLLFMSIQILMQQLGIQMVSYIVLEIQVNQLRQKKQKVMYHQLVILMAGQQMILHMILDLFQQKTEDYIQRLKHLLMLIRNLRLLKIILGMMVDMDSDLEIHQNIRIILALEMKITLLR